MRRYWIFYHVRTAADGQIAHSGYCEMTRQLPISDAKCLAECGQTIFNSLMQQGLMAPGHGIEAYDFRRFEDESIALAQRH